MDTRIPSLIELKDYARCFLASCPEGACVALSGPLGAGKTAFVRSILECITESSGRTLGRVTSPSFVLHQSYRDYTPTIEHFDLYRLEAVSEAMLVELGFYEAREHARATQGFLFVEWPEKVLDTALLGIDITLTIRIDGAARWISR